MRRFHLPLPPAWSAFALATLCACLLAGCSPAMQGSMALAKGDYNLALKRYNEALAQNPGSLHLRQRIGLTYFAKKDYAQAEASFQDILNRSPGEPNALFYLGLSRIGKGETAAALDEFTRFSWPDKYYQQKYVREEAERLLRHPEMPPAELIRCLQDALEEGRQFQIEVDLEMWRGVSR
jgi:tetratricopeptide (TPR) repeat protein